jgi:hypothetical protein
MRSTEAEYINGGLADRAGHASPTADRRTRSHTGKPLRSGDICPHCQKDVLDYDGQLNLSCAECGYAVGGCFT